MERRVLLTGARGFIGRAVLPALVARGFVVHATCRGNPPPEPEPEVRWHRSDLHNGPAAERLLDLVAPTHLLHLAWLADPGATYGSMEHLRWVETSVRLLRAFAASGGQRAVLAGTCAEYDWSCGYCSENATPTRPGTLYGASKLALGSLGAALTHEAALSVASGRVFFVYGPRENPRRLVPAIARPLLRGERAPTSDGEQIRDFLPVAEVACAFAALLDSEVEGPVNIASGEPVRVREIVARVADLIGRPELVGWGELPRRPAEAPVVVGDVRRLREEVGVPRGRAGLDGLGEAVEWWRGVEGV